jgi:hypothetical protein
LQFDIPVYDILFMEIVDGSDELVAEVSDGFQRKRVVMLDILKKRVFSSVLYHQANFGESFDAFVQFNHPFVV